MIEEEIIDFYGKETWTAMKDSKYLDGITISIRDGEPDIPKEDLERAYKDIRGIPIHQEEWD